MKDAVKKAQSGVAAKASNVSELLRVAFSAIDKAAERGMIHRNRAARSKSRLALKAGASSGSPA